MLLDVFQHDHSIGVTDHFIPDCFERPDDDHTRTSTRWLRRTTATTGGT